MYVAVPRSRALVLRLRLELRALWLIAQAPDTDCSPSTVTTLSQLGLVAFEILSRRHGHCNAGIFEVRNSWSAIPWKHLEDAFVRLFD